MVDAPLQNAAPMAMSGNFNTVRSNSVVNELDRQMLIDEIDMCSMLT